MGATESRPQAQPSQSQQQQAGCPVDHKAREAWLENAKQQRQLHLQSSPLPSPSAAAEGCDSSKIDLRTSPPALSPSPSQKLSRDGRLGTDREVSSIPRTSPSEAASAEAASAAAAAAEAAANAERETGRDTRTGNWIYPSEHMFFEAMRRKNYEARAEDMRTIVPIHNAVNERAWKEIKQWEEGRGSEKCGGPKLHSFSGTSTALTPKARLNTLLGYQPPFDRHDWVVDRCGKRVEYVIDFYSGRDERRPGKSLNFYLDVRPKLNSWEGWRMRMERLVGL